MKKLNVTLVKQKNIKHIYASKVVKKNYIVSLVLVCVLALGCLMLKTDGLTEISKNCANVYNPINPLFNDDGGITFASNNLLQVSNSSLKFITPIKCSNITVSNNEVHFEIDSNIMIVSPEAGIISAIGVLPNGEKYVEIKHSKNIVSRLENIHIVGVVNGEAVNKGKDIAIAKLGTTVRFSILEDGVKQPNISVVKNEIVWESFQ